MNVPMLRVEWPIVRIGVAPDLPCADLVGAFRILLLTKPRFRDRYAERVPRSTKGQ